MTICRELSWKVVALTIVIGSACAGVKQGVGGDDDAGSAPPDAVIAFDGGLPPDAEVLDPGCLPEACDGFDNDCDGDIDEICTCVPGRSKACYTGPAGTRFVGQCRDGEMWCVGGDQEFGQWGECAGSVLPGVEVCDEAGEDEDCDGTVNEGCNCVDGQSVPCGSDVGACSAGIQECIGGMLGPCVGAVGPTSETCNDIDDDCDGVTDEELYQPCGSDVGACSPGTSTCSAGQWGQCEGATTESPETCNGLDDDCDGDTDEDTELACGLSEGACQQGTSYCSGGTYGDCIGEIGPTAEGCNNVDDDCDGTIDEGLVQPCGEDQGACSLGQSTCSAGQWGTCVGGVGPTGESCNGIDDDCDGDVDEGLTRSCGSDEGECTSGIETCVSGLWGGCTGFNGGPEICNGLDDDCDGIPDNGCDCVNGQQRPCGTNEGECTEGTETCVNGQWGACTGGSTGGPEVCNGLDDDCDGIPDNGCDCTNGEERACGSDEGECTEGTETCVNGQWGACTGGFNGSSEVCNGLDDDCDGIPDNGCDCTNGEQRPCGTNEGECTEGTETCVNGQWGACTGGSTGGPEVCNGLDDDCDGIPDNGCDCIDGEERACGTNEGECTEGTETCVNGQWGACTGGSTGGPEVCNGLDDDCDGIPDNGCDCINGDERPCGNGTGACEPGYQDCINGAWSVCIGEVTGTPEVCNGIDDDCDGDIDEWLVLDCGTDEGACEPGYQYCTNGSWDPCTGETGPVDEVCDNGIDDDCDGATDEVGCPGPPEATCPGDIVTEPLTTVSLAGGGVDPDGGTVSCEWEIIDAPAGSSSQPNSPFSCSTVFFVDLAGTYTVQLTVTDDEGETATCEVIIEAIPQEELHVELVWDTEWGDADLHLMQAGVNPVGNWYLSEQDCFWNNATAAWPPAGPDGNAALDRDDLGGFGPETINVDSNPSAGTYTIGVAYYCQRSIPDIGVEGPTTATVKIFCNGALVDTIGGITLESTGRFVTVGEVTWPGCATTTLLDSSWTAQVQPTGAYASPLHCSIACNDDSQCTPGERCNTGTGTCALACASDADCASTTSCQPGGYCF